MYKSFSAAFELYRAIDGAKNLEFEAIKIVEILREETAESKNSITFVLES